MNKWMTSVMITIFLSFTIVLLIVIFILDNFTGVYLKTVDDNIQIQDKMLESLQVEEAQFINKYSLSEITYISLIVEDEKTSYVWYNELGEVLIKLDQNIYNEEDAFKKCSDYEVMNCEVEIGYYQDEPMIVLNGSNKEVLLQFETYELKLVYDKRVVN